MQHLSAYFSNIFLGEPGVEQKNLRRRLRHLRLRHASALLGSLLLFAHIAVSPTPAVAYSAMLDRLDDRYSGYPNVLEASERLRDGIAAARTSFSDGMEKELETNIINELELLLSGVEDYHTEDYRAAALGMRLLELSYDVRAAVARLGDTDEDRRNEATEQYNELISYFDNLIAAKGDRLDSTVAGMLGDALRATLEEPANNILAWGYGRPLSRSEYDELAKLVSDSVKQASAFSQTLGDNGLESSKLREAARIVNDGRDRLREAVREYSVAASEAEIAAPRQSNELWNRLSTQLTEAEEKEIASMVAHTQATAEKFQIEDAPSTPVQPHDLHTHDAMSESDENQSLGTWLIAANVCVVVSICALILVKRRRQKHTH